MPKNESVVHGSAFEVRNCDALELLSDLPDSSVDLMVSSPPYCIGKDYDTTVSVEDFLEEQRRVLPEITRALRSGGSLCWQIGHHVRDNVVVPLDALVYAAASAIGELRLRNRIVWTFGHGFHATNRFSGRHETILWFTLGDEYYFDLNSVRIPQKYPGKRHYKGPQKGQWSGNPLGKNPGDVWDARTDVWDIPNVKAGHVEKTDHPCQFPVALASRLVRALCPAGGLVMDPYMGSGSAGVAALLEQRRFVGCDTSKAYIAIAERRLRAVESGEAAFRPDVPTTPPNVATRVAQLPPHFANTRLEEDA